MTATQPRRGPSTTSPAGGPPHLRSRHGVVYGYDLRDPATGSVHRDDYVGQARDLVRRDRQHRGLAQQRNGQVREQPWADLIVSGPHILEQRVWTDAELTARELWWIGRCLPRQNCLDNPNPDRIPIWKQEQQRDQRDAEKGLPARNWGRARRTVVPLPPSIGTRLARWVWNTLVAALRRR